ncbi:kinase-like protein [Gigaspora margarita]|uniref:Kinase-like protein n=1 Tax=Gigaspora margarita TaxID=4874 RepID=A0A8H4A6L9_GIGMA|nr:kinase-like protein [Gigaspora margarita]
MGRNIQNEEPISENWLEKAICERHIYYIDYNKFTDPMVIGIEGFEKVFKYEWKDVKLMVALNCLKVDTSIDEKVIKFFTDEFTKLQWADKLRIAKETALGFLFLHDKNIIHKDLHSKNILIHQGQSKIINFGLAKQMNEMSITSNSIIHEMPTYIDPQYFIKRGYKRDKRSDVYNFGQILCEISSGRSSFTFVVHK